MNLEEKGERNRLDNKKECFSQPHQEDIEKVEEHSFITPSIPIHPNPISISSHGELILITYQCKANRIFYKEEGKRWREEGEFRIPSSLQPPLISPMEITIHSPLNYCIIYDCNYNANNNVNNNNIDNNNNTYNNNKNSRVNNNNNKKLTHPIPPYNNNNNNNNNNDNNNDNNNNLNNNLSNNLIKIKNNKKNNFCINNNLNNNFNITNNINNNRILIFNIKTRDLIYLYQPSTPTISYPLPWPKHRHCSIKYLNIKMPVLSLICDEQNHSSKKNSLQGKRRRWRRGFFTTCFYILILFSILFFFFFSYLFVYFFPIFYSNCKLELCGIMRGRGFHLLFTSLVFRNRNE